MREFDIIMRNDIHLWIRLSGLCVKQQAINHLKRGFLMDLRIIHAKDVRRFTVIYQFEHEEIKQCEYCKLCDLDYDWCNMQSCLIDKYESPKVNNCPLVAISKTETTGCRYCRGIESHGIVAVKTVIDEYLRVIPAYDTPQNYCPNCGRKIKEQTGGTERKGRV